MSVVSEEVGKNICEAVGNNMLADNIPQSISLMAFLADAFEYSFKRPPDSAYDYGYVWSLFIGHLEKAPDDPASIEFNELNEAWLSER